MSIIVKSEGGDFEQLSPGTYRAVCKGVFDIGLQKNEYKGEVKYKEQIIIIFEVDERMSIEQYSGERFNMIKWYNKSLHEKANLRRDLENWRGRTFTHDELKEFDVEKLVGVNCTLSIIKNDHGKSVIGSISKKMSGQEDILIEKPYTDIPQWVMDIKAKSVMDNKVEKATESLDNAMNGKWEDDSDIPF